MLMGCVAKNVVLRVEPEISDQTYELLVPDFRFCQIFQLKVLPNKLEPGLSVPIKSGPMAIKELGARHKRKMYS